MRTRPIPLADRRDRFLVRRLCMAALLAPLLFAAVPLAAQDSDNNRFEDLFSAYLGDNAEGYLQPVGTILGASLNSGLMRPARIGPGFHFRFDALVANSLISNTQKVFRATTEEGFNPQTTTDAPTILGAGEPKVIEGDGGTAYIFPAGLDLDRIGVILPQVTIGNVMGTEATVRWLAYSFEDIGDLSLLGVGGRHSISQYLENAPVDLAVGFFYHTVEFADMLNLTAMLASVNASITRSVFTLYGGLGYETSSMHVGYDSKRAASGRVELDLDGVNGIRATAGVSLGLPLLTIFADVSAGSQTVFTLGLGLGG